MNDARSVDLPNLATVALHREVLLQAVTFRAPNSVLYTTLGRYDPRFADHHSRDIYVDRRCAVESVSLLQLPNEATVLGRHHFALKVGRRIIMEQYPIFYPSTPQKIEELLDTPFGWEYVEKEALLIARYGIFTWGHWLGELLPKAILAERLYPKRFTLILPHEVLTETGQNRPWSKIKQSLEAYGFDESRIFPARHDRDYRFRRLFAVTPVWSDHVMHPEAVELMRTMVEGASDMPTYSRVAIRRLASDRALENRNEIETLLRSKGFEVLLTGAMSFLDQISVFRNARILFGVLGSDLTNLIYSPHGVKVITVAPAQFGDRFFYALIVARNGQQIDLRGPITERNEEVIHRSAFSVDPSEVARAVQLMGG
jgi:capsular polysaccharide biosynthesis protein